MSGKRRGSAWLGTFVLFVTGLLLAAPGALAAQQIITTSGPLNNIYLNDNTGCQVTHTGDTENEFFGDTDPGACGTFLAVPGEGGPTVYGPDVPSGNDRTPYTLVSQSAVSGSGTSADPFRVTTVVDAGSTGLRITQVDSYVVGQEFWRTSVTLHNSAIDDQTVNLYRAADCFLQNSDEGKGFFQPATGGIFCAENANNSPQGRIEGFSPDQSGTHYIESDFQIVWDAIDGTDFPDTCDCDVFQDNGMGLSWALTVPGDAGGDITRSFANTFSPTGTIPDTTPPDTTITNGPPEGSTTNDTTPTFEFTSSEANSTFECSIDGGPFQGCSSPDTIGPLADGQHTLQVRATDAAGNVDQSPASRTFTVQAPPRQPKCHGEFATIVGTAHADLLHGTSAADVFVARRGNDIILAGDGDDIVCAAKGNDTVRGGDGDDILGGGKGGDTVRGGEGNDEARGKRGNDTVGGGKGDDVLGGGRGDDTVRGGGGDDVVRGKRGDDVLGGGEGDDRIFGAGGADQLFGAAGSDFLGGGDQDDALHGGSGADTCEGGKGDDSFSGCESGHGAGP
jgi:hypothetical protein